MLKVVTAVGDVTITETVKKVDGEDQQTRAEQYLNAKAIVSTIDLVDGDIETIMDGVFASDNAAYNKIRDEHMLRIKDAHDIVGNNVKVLKELINTIRDILAARPVPETESITLKAE
jgi:transcription antitermination factor NusG